MKCLLYFLSLCQVLEFVTSAHRQASSADKIPLASTFSVKQSSSSSKDSYTQLPVIVRVKDRRSRTKKREAKVIGLSYRLFRILNIELPPRMDDGGLLPFSLTLLFDCDGDHVNCEFEEGTDQLFKSIVPRDHASKGRRFSGALAVQTSKLSNSSKLLHPARFREMVLAFQGDKGLFPPIASYEQEFLETPETRIFSRYLKSCVAEFAATGEAKKLGYVLSQKWILQQVAPAFFRELSQSLATVHRTVEQQAVLKVFIFTLLYISPIGSWEPPAMLSLEELTQIRETGIAGVDDILVELFSCEGFLRRASVPMVIRNLKFIPTRLLDLALELHPEIATALAVEVVNRYYQTTRNIQIHDGGSEMNVAMGSGGSLHEDSHELSEAHCNTGSKLLKSFSRALATIHQHSQLLEEFPMIWTALAENASTMYDVHFIDLARPLILLAVTHHSKTDISNLGRELTVKRNFSRHIMRRFFIAKQLVQGECFDTKRPVIRQDALRLMGERKARQFLRVLEWYLRVFQLRPLEMSPGLLEHLAQCIEICECAINPSKAANAKFIEKKLRGRGQAHVLAIWQQFKANSSSS